LLTSAQSGPVAIAGISIPMWQKGQTTQNMVRSPSEN
jgi:hypothetical protein